MRASPRGASPIGIRSRKPQRIVSAIRLRPDGHGDSEPSSPPPQGESFDHCGSRCRRPSPGGVRPLAAGREMTGVEVLGSVDELTDGTGSLIDAATVA